MKLLVTCKELENYAHAHKIVVESLDTTRIIHNDTRQLLICLDKEDVINPYSLVYYIKRFYNVVFPDKISYRESRSIDIDKIRSEVTFLMRNM